MLNRFEHCKTLVDLYNVFATEENIQDYSTLSEGELDRVAVVFEANITNRTEMPDVPLTEAGYEYIWNVVVETVETMVNENMEEETMNNTTVKGNVEAAVEELVNKFDEAKAYTKVNIGETKDEYINRNEDALNIMKGALGTTLDTIDSILGYSLMKNRVLAIIEAGTDGKTSKKDLFKMAKKCRDFIDAEIEDLMEFGDEEDFKKAVQLKALTEGVRGKSIFEAFASGVIWIGKKVARKLRQWFQVDEEKSIIGAICRSVADFANVLRAGLKIVWNTAKFAVSFIIAGAIKLFITIKSVVLKIKNWAVEKYNTMTNKDAEEDIEEEEEVTE